MHIICRVGISPEFHDSVLWFPVLYGKEIISIVIKNPKCNHSELHAKYFPKQLPNVRFQRWTKGLIGAQNNADLKSNLLMGHKNEMQKQRKILKNGFHPCSELLGGTVGHAFSHMHTYPPHSSCTDNWTVLWRI